MKRFKWTEIAPNIRTAKIPNRYNEDHRAALPWGDILPLLRPDVFGRIKPEIFALAPPETFE